MPRRLDHRSVRVGAYAGDARYRAPEAVRSRCSDLGLLAEAQRRQMLFAASAERLPSLGCIDLR